MYYKITKKSNKIYKKLRAVREKEIENEKKNRETVEKLIGFELTLFVGVTQQHSLDRMTSYSGFKFPDGVTPDPKVWVKSKKFPDYYVPNRRTKVGREMAKSLHSLPSVSSSWDIWEAIGVKTPYRSFSIPALYLSGNGDVIIYLDDNMEPTDKDVIEITRTEFNKTLEAYPEKW